MPIDEAPTRGFNIHGGGTRYMNSPTDSWLTRCTKSGWVMPSSRAFTRIEVRHIVRGRGVSEAAVASAIELSETKYCSVAATLRPGVEIVTTYEVIEDSE